MAEEIVGFVPTSESDQRLGAVSSGTVQANANQSFALRNTVEDDRSGIFEAPGANKNCREVRVDAVQVVWLAELLGDLEGFAHTGDRSVVVATFGDANTERAERVTFLGTSARSPSNRDGFEATDLGLGAASQQHQAPGFFGDDGG